MTPTCTACGTTLPVDVYGWVGECPHCHQQNDPAEVLL